jgi:hypothetical protein
MKPLVVTLLLVCSSVLGSAIPTSMAQEMPVEDSPLLPVEEAGTARESMPETLEESVDLGDAIVGVAVMNEQIQTLCRLEYGDEVCRAEGLLQ